MKKPIIQYLTVSQFNEFKRGLSLISGIVFNKTEEYGYTITVGDDVFIILCNNPSLSRVEKDIVYWHEKAHASGIPDEEEADRWAFKHLDDEGKDLLIKNWKYRHGHNF